MLRMWLEEPADLCCLVREVGTLYGKKVCEDCYFKLLSMQDAPAYEEKKKEKNTIKETSSPS